MPPLRAIWVSIRLRKAASLNGMCSAVGDAGDAGTSLRLPRYQTQKVVTGSRFLRYHQAIVEDVGGWSCKSPGKVAGQNLAGRPIARRGAVATVATPADAAIDKARIHVLRIVILRRRR
jgi:hypothetical protein